MQVQRYQTGSESGTPAGRENRLAPVAGALVAGSMRRLGFVPAAARGWVRAEEYRVAVPRISGACEYCGGTGYVFDPAAFGMAGHDNLACAVCPAGRLAFAAGRARRAALALAAAAGRECCDACKRAVHPDDLFDVFGVGRCCGWCAGVWDANDLPADWDDLDGATALPLPTRAERAAARGKGAAA